MNSCVNGSPTILKVPSKNQVRQMARKWNICSVPNIKCLSFLPSRVGTMTILFKKFGCINVPSIWNITLSLARFVGRDPARVRLTARTRFCRTGNSTFDPLSSRDCRAFLDISGAESDGLVFAAIFASLENLIYFVIFLFSNYF